MSKLKNGTQRVLAALLSLCMLLAVLPGAALAEDQPQKQTIHIASAQDLVSLAENCRLDSWSKEKLVILDKDIDLTGVDFEGIPTFGGEFQGGSHRITGVSLTQDGSAVGFFRYVQEGALINELTVSGNVVPGGSRSTVGGISGKNEGTIQGCWILSTIMSLDTQKGLWAMTNLPKLVKAEGATNYSSNGGSSWAIINDKDLDLALDFMQMYRNVDFYNEILPATSAIATYTPAKEGSNYTAGSEFFNGEPIFAEIVEFGAQTPSNITGPYYYDAREALGTAITNIILQGGDVDTELATAEDTVNFTMGF